MLHCRHNFVCDRNLCKHDEVKANKTRHVSDGEGVEAVTVCL